MRTPLTLSSLLLLLPLLAVLFFPIPALSSVAAGNIAEALRNVEDISVYDRQSPVPVYPRIARCPGELSVESPIPFVMAGLPLSKNAATLNIPGYIMHVAAAALLFVAAAAFWIQLVWLGATAQIGGLAAFKLSLFPLLLSVSFILAVYILKTPGALIGSVLRFVPMAALALVALTMGLRVVGLTMHPEFASAFHNTGFVLDLAWMVVACPLGLATAWSWLVRTRGDSFLTPWIVRRIRVQDSGRTVDPEKGQKEGEGNGEAGNEEEGSDGQQNLGYFATTRNTLKTSAAMLSSVSAFILMAYFGSVLGLGMASGAASPAMVAILAPSVVLSVLLFFSTLVNRSNGYVVAAHLAVCAAGFIIVAQCIWPHSFSATLFTISPENSALFARPVAELRELVVTTPQITDASDIFSSFLPLSWFQSPGSAPPAASAAPDGTSAAPGMFDWLKQNLHLDISPTELSAGFVFATVVINAGMLFAAGSAAAGSAAAGSAAAGSAGSGLLGSFLTNVASVIRSF